MIARRGLLAFTSLTVALTLLAGSATAFAYAWKGTSGDRIRLRDGSCVAADQLRTRSKLQDGSCRLAADQLRTRAKLQDGSCLVAFTRTWTRDRVRDRSCDGTCTGTGTLDQLRTRSRLRDGSCTA